MPPDSIPVPSSAMDMRVVSNGPDRKYSQAGTPQDAFNPNPSVLLGADVPYDATNGTVASAISFARRSSRAPPRRKGANGGQSRSQNNLTHGTRAQQAT